MLEVLYVKVLKQVGMFVRQKDNKKNKINFMSSFHHLLGSSLNYQHASSADVKMSIQVQVNKYPRGINRFNSVSFFLYFELLDSVFSKSSKVSMYNTVYQFKHKLNILVETLIFLMKCIFTY